MTETLITDVGPECYPDTASEERREVRCPMCNSLVFVVVNRAYIEIRQRHHGEIHQWQIPLKSLLE